MITIVGGGPAGLAAALAGAQAGADVLLIESGPRLGGQYWRHLEDVGPRRWTGQEDLHHDFAAGQSLRNAILSNPRIKILLNASVWHASYIGGEATLHVLVAGVDREIKSRALILATGAYDRTLPFPGWDIPGVMTVGGVQSLLKGNYVLAGKRVVVAGTGPFLLPVAAGLADSGVEIVALVDANPLRRWLPKLHIALTNFSKLQEGAHYFSTLFKHRIHLSRGRTVIAAQAGSDGKLISVTIAKVDRNFKVRDKKLVECDALAIGWGFTADLSLANNLGLKQELNPVDNSVIVTVNELQCTNLESVFAAGEITGIGGAQLSLTEGRIAGIAAAAHIGAIDHPTLLESVLGLQRKRKGQKKFAQALLSVYSVKSGWREWLTNDTIICRCEEVSLAQLKYAIHELGATDTRTAKLFTRTGMGMCQGRICGRTVIEIVACESGVNPTIQDHVTSGNRPVVHPIALDVIANL